jgi:hypothetical protein
MLKLFIAPAVVIFTINSALAQINGSDPSLRLWLKAETCDTNLTYPVVTNIPAVGGIPGSSGIPLTIVPIWNDSSSYGLGLQVPPLPAADCHNDSPDHVLTNHTPLLITATNNGKVFNAVFFRQAYDPVCEAHWHWADRLWQTNQLDQNDPTLIYPTNDMTMVIVWLNYANDIWIGPGQAIIDKRGDGGTDWQFGYSGVDVAPYAFNGTAVYEATQLLDPKGAGNREWGIHIMSLTTTNAVWYDYYASKYGWRTQTTAYSPGTPQVGTPVFMAGYAASGAAGLYERASAAFAEIAMWNRTLTPAELASIQQQLLTKYFVNAGPPVVVAPPLPATVNQYDPVTFAVNVDGTPPFQYQWLKDGQPVTKGAGANGPVFTIPIVGPSDQGFYSVAITNSLGWTNSVAAYLTVVLDLTPPTITTVLLNALDNTQVKVTFSELVNPASATNTAFYSINNGVTISSITAIPQTNNLSWSNYVYSVILNTSGVSVNSKLNASGVQDRGGNVMLATQKDIFVPAVSGAPPTQNMVLWVKADTGVFADLSGVYDWGDQSGASRDFNSVLGFPQMGMADFPNAVHPVVTFNLNDTLVNGFPADFKLQNYTIYIVGAADTNSARALVGNYRGYAVENNANQVHFGAVTTSGEIGLNGGTLQNQVPFYSVATFSPPNATLSVNGTVVSVLTNVTAMDYTTDNRGLCLGALYADGHTHGLVGNIAEVLIYSDVSPTRDATIQTYVATKYFAPSPATPKLVSAAVSTMTNTSVTVMFNLPPTAASAGNSANYSLNNGATVNAATVLNSTTVQLTTSPLNSALAYTLTASVTDWTGVAPSSQVALVFPGSPIRYQDSTTNGLLVIEAEHYSQNTPAGGQAWTLVANSPWLVPTATDTNVSGAGCMIVLPDIGNSYTFVLSNTPAGVAQLDYKVWFANAGTNYVWIRGSGDSGTAPGLGTGDSVNLGLDGVFYYRMFGQWPQSAGYAWGKNPTPISGVFRVPTAGYHVLNLWERADGFAVDKIVLTSNRSYTPTGVGPAESSTNAPTTYLPPITITRGASGLTLTWSVGTLQSALNAAGPYSDVSGANSPYNVTPTNTAQYFRARQ